MINGLDIMLLLKLSGKQTTRVQSKQLAQELFLTPSEVTQSLKRCQASGLLFWSDLEKRVNKTGLLEFLTHGLRYVFPAQRGTITRGIPTSIATEPLKSKFQKTLEPPPVWPDPDGSVRGLALQPLHNRVPKAAMADPDLYQLLALVDAVRSARVRERQAAVQELSRRLNPDA